MDSRQHDNDDSSDRALARDDAEREKVRRSPNRERNRLLFVCVLLFCPLLLHSCTMSEMKMSLGPAAPIVVVDMDTNSFQPLGLEDFSAIGLTMNIGLAIALAYAVATPEARGFLTSAAFRYSLLIFVLVSNCVLLCPVLPFLTQVWIYGVMHPNSLIFEFIRPPVESIALAMSEPGADAPAGVDQVIFAISSRLYMVIFLAAGTATPKLAIWFYRHVLQPSPDRWWQISLRGWFALTLLLGAIISLVLFLTR